MVKIQNSIDLYLYKIVSLTTLFVFCVSLWGCSNTAQADSQENSTITPELEKQVLEIIRKNPQVIIEAVQNYQAKQEEDLKQARQKFIQDLQTNPQSIIESSPQTGAKNSKITIVEFSDFQCPFCAKANDNLKQFMAKHGKEVTLVYKHLPLTKIHSEALPAAKAAWAAQQQGKFWEYHDALFDNQEQLGESLYLEIAKKLNLDLKKFEIDRTKAQTEIDRDLALANKLGLDGTPVIIMNDQYMSGAVEVSELEARLEAVKKNLQ
jgi:protein-disulfide isomerase